MVRNFEPADSLPDGSGEGALFVPEQFTLQQPGGNSGAIQLDERLRSARAEFMNRAGD